MNNDISEAIEGLKRYLGYLKTMGINEIPVEQQSVVSSQWSEKPTLQTLNLKPQIMNTDSIISPPSSLEEIQKEIGDCRRCKLWHTRKNIVFGSGNPKTELVFVGEGPGEDEDIQGLPFVGRAGQKLTEIIEKGIAAIKPKVIVTLGRPATATLLNSKKITISKIRGVWHEYSISTGIIKLMPTYHPAYLLRNYTPEVRRQVYEDVKKVREELKKI